VFTVVFYAFKWLKYLADVKFKWIENGYVLCCLIRLGS